MAKRADRTFRPGRARALLAVAALVAALGGCHTARSFKERVDQAAGKLTGSNFDDPEADAKLKRAEELFQNKDYAPAQDQFRALADNKGNSAALAERARFMQAECRYMRKQLPEAADTYHKVLLDFPTGAYRRDACARIFDICDYWLDDFRDELKARQDEKGVLRWKPGLPNPLDRTRPTWGQEERTLESLQRVHVHDVTGPTADKALFWCGYINFVRGNFNEADQFFSQLDSMHPDSPLRPQAMAFAILAKNNATGGAAYDGRKCAEALQLVHVAEASVPELANNPEMAEKLTRAKFAIRSQQAEKDYLMADYYERTGHPGSAVFYYELVRRRYAGTKYADQATERQTRLVKLMQEGRPDPGVDPLAVVRAKFDEVWGKRPAATKEPAGGVVPAGGPVPDSARGARP
ncbi:MAG: tetratricopeptide repeat protein [Planctomycetes bacterium]|nr:tetratricopeptide repeat protein [Planctomycetota bacterium]